MPDNPPTMTTAQPLVHHKDRILAVGQRVMAYDSNGTGQSGTIIRKGKGFFVRFDTLNKGRRNIPVEKVYKFGRLWHE